LEFFGLKIYHLATLDAHGIQLVVSLVSEAENRATTSGCRPGLPDGFFLNKNRISG
jgi:hypothetical protein